MSELLIKGGMWFLSALLVKKMIELRKNNNEQEKQAFEQWDAQKEVTVEELGTILERRYNTEINENIEEYIDCGEFFVRDRIECDHPLTSNIHKNKLIFQSIITKTSIKKVRARSNRRNINHPEMEEETEFIPTDQSFVSVFELRSVRNQNSGQFQSYNQQAPSYICYVEDPQSAKIGKAIQFLGRTKQETLIAEDQLQFGCVQVNLDNSLKTTTKTERGIKVGEVVTVLGKVLFNPKQRAIKIVSPTHILTSKKELKSFYSSFNMVNIGLFFFSVTSSVLLYTFIAAIQDSE